MLDRRLVHMLGRISRFPISRSPITARVAGTLAVLLAAVAVVAVATGTFPRSACLGDVDGDGVRELLMVTGNPLEQFGRQMTVFLVDRKSWTGLRGLNPWKVASGDVDGDGRSEILVGVWKTTRLDPVFDRRLFVYAWSEQGPVPRWLGSRLSRPFVDFGVEDADGDGGLELVAVELERSGAFSTRAYKWSGFGFEAVDGTEGQPGDGLAGRVP
ncbi:MAG: VCBS repeat-containing protein [Firmicutes bacterium]|nr:VCBS repeat-containing protein [Bacillota bacterium]